MKVLCKGRMPDNTKIQMEDWSKDFPSLHTENDVIAAYPVAKRSAKRRTFEAGSFFTCVWEYPKMYQEFRLALKFGCARDAEEAYKKLLCGEAKLLDYKDYMREKAYASCISE